MKRRIVHNFGIRMSRKVKAKRRLCTWCKLWMTSEWNVPQSLFICLAEFYFLEKQDAIEEV